METSCTNTTPGYPANSSYTPNNPLSGFDGGNLNGTWTLNASDSAADDTGTVVDWCVVIEYTP
ncbi:MAG: proprotein convertase P-domain-containing protein [Chloroflexi bacterium]|nr:proprotein convertase P-domain-containing protein [Chloroflexota bacterium]